MKTFFIKTLGCKVNQYDSQVIREQFLGDGFREVTSNENLSPDICIVNTCSVTNRASSKGRNYINHLRRIYPESTLVATGCTVDYQPESINEKVNFLISNKDKSSLADMFTENKNKKNNHRITNFSGRTRAFVKVQDGCNEFCSYCVLPYVRGRSTSRDSKSIIDEVKILVHNGYREIVLTGIHLGDYGRNKGKQNVLVKLLKELEIIDKLARIRLSSLEPQDITEQLIEKIAESSKICKHLHIPLQSGNNIILKNMNRKYTYKQYKNLLEKIRNRIPNINFTTDIIAGFPGETERQFLDSCKAIEKLQFVKVHVFPYSLRAKTIASSFSNRVEAKDIKSRARALQEISQKTEVAVKKKLIGSLQEILIEKSGVNSTGYTSGYMPVLVKSHVISNTLIKVKITDINKFYLVGAEVVVFY